MSDSEPGSGPVGPVVTDPVAVPPVGGQFTPAQRRPRVPADPRVLGWRFAVAAAVGAVGFDLAVRNPPWNNIAASVAVIGLAIAMVGSGRLVSPSSKVALGLAAVLGFFLWFRTDPVLVVFDIVGIFALAWYGVIHSRGRTIWDTGPFRLLVRAAETVLLGLETVLVDSASELNARQRRARTSGRLASNVGAGVVRGLAIAVPLLIVLGLLLASADAVFASFFDVGVGVDVPVLIGHACALLFGALLAVTLLRLAGRDMSSPGDNTDMFRLGRIEALVVLGALDLLFAVFAIAQIVALTGGADRVLASAGLTFKQYARQGFFQLLWVAAITLVVLVTINAVTKHLGAGRRPVVITSLLAVGLTLLIVVVAFGRLRLYITDDGLTPLRFYSSVFSVWIAVIFALVAVRIVGRWASVSWLTTAVGLSGVLLLIGLNVANPEAIIANNNLHRDEAGILYHMDKLTADGQVVLFDGLDRLSPELRADVQEKLCAATAYDEFDFSRTGFGYNRSERRIEERMTQYCDS